MKKIIIILAVVLLAIIAVPKITSGFAVRSDVYLSDYYVNSDGSKITMTVGVFSSIGYTRGYNDESGEAKSHYLKFYSAFGGLNGSIGAKKEFELELQPDDTEIYFYRGGQGYELILKKDEITGSWIKNQ